MKDNQERINHVYTKGSFARLFWEEQFKAASLACRRKANAMASCHDDKVVFEFISLMSGCSYDEE